MLVRSTVFSLLAGAEHPIRAVFNQDTHFRTGIVFPSAACGICAFLVVQDWSAVAPRGFVILQVGGCRLESLPLLMFFSAGRPQRSTDSADAPGEEQYGVGMSWV